MTHRTRPTRPQRALAVALGLLAAPVTAAADALCDALAAADTGALTALFDGSALFTGCGPAQAGQGLAVCLWEFPLRDPVAPSLFVALDARVSACGQVEQSTSDMSVNHPDSYRARIHRFAGHDAVLALKDKGALGLTRVTIRLAPRG